MGLIQALSDIVKGLRRPATEQERQYAAASIRTAEEVAGSAHNSINPIDFGRVGRAVTGSVFNASSIIATECASYPLKLYRRKGTGRKPSKAKAVSSRTAAFLRGEDPSLRPTAKAQTMADNAEEIEEVTDHPVLSLLRDPDPVTTGSDFLTMLYWYREVAGKCYVWTGERVKGEPTGLYILHPQYVQVVLDRREYITGYRYGREQTGIMEVPAADVIYSRYMPDPFRPWDGTSWVSSVELYADSESAALTAEIARWKNSGQSGMIVSVPSVYTDDQVKQVEAAMKGKGGPLAAGRALVLRDATIVQASGKPHEMGYVTGLEQTEKAIYRAAGIPEAVWKLNDANLAGAAMGREMLASACYKRMRRVAEDLTEYLLPMYGEDPESMWFGYENPVREAVDAEAQRFNAAFAAGVVYVNEYRKVLDLPPVDDDMNTLGRPVVPTMIAPPMVAPAQEMEDGAEDPEDGGYAASTDTGSGESGSGASDGESEDAGDVADAAGANNASEDAAKGASQLIARWGAHPCACGHAHKSTTDDSIERSIFRAVQAWAEDAMKRGIAAIQPDGTFDISALSSDELQGLLGNAITAAFESGAAAMSMEVGSDAPPLTSDAARTYIAQYNFDLVRGVTETMADQMRTTISAGLEKGQTINEIQQELTDRVPEVSLNRAEVIARTETARAYQHGSIKQAEELGFSSKEWSLSGNPCGLCEGADAALQGKKVPIGQPFFPAGSTIAGTDGRTYTTTMPIMVASELHPNCSCGTVTVVEGD